MVILILIIMVIVILVAMVMVILKHNGNVNIKCYIYEKNHHTLHKKAVDLFLKFMKNILLKYLTM